MFTPHQLLAYLNKKELTKLAGQEECSLTSCWRIKAPSP